MDSEQAISWLSGLILAWVFVTYAPQELTVSYAVIALFFGLLVAFLRFYEVARLVGINKPLLLRFFRSYAVIVVASALIATVANGSLTLNAGSLKLSLALLLALELSLLPGERRPYTFILSIPLILRNPIYGYIASTVILLIEERLRGRFL